MAKIDSHLSRLGLPARLLCEPGLITSIYPELPVTPSLRRLSALVGFVLPAVTFAASPASAATSASVHHKSHAHHVSSVTHKVKPHHVSPVHQASHHTTHHPSHKVTTS